MISKFLRSLSRTVSKPSDVLKDPKIVADSMGNFIRIAPEVLRNSGFRLSIEGHGNYVDVCAPIELGHLHIEVYGGAHVSIGMDCILRSVHIFAAQESFVVIGNNVLMNGHCRFLSHEPKKLRVGDGCLFAGNIDVTTSDMHSIIDLHTGHRINKGKDVTINDKVWIGQNVTITKGSIIGSNSVIGTSSVVTRQIPPNSVAAGVPARVIRRGVRWIHDNK